MGWGNVGFGELSVKCFRILLRSLPSTSAAATSLSEMSRCEDWKRIGFGGQVEVGYRMNVHG